MKKSTFAFMVIPLIIAACGGSAGPTEPTPIATTATPESGLSTFNIGELSIQALRLMGDVAILNSLDTTFSLPKTAGLKAILFSTESPVYVRIQLLALGGRTTLFGTTHPNPNTNSTPVNLFDGTIVDPDGTEREVEDMPLGIVVKDQWLEATVTSNDGDVPTAIHFLQVDQTDNARADLLLRFE